MQINRIEHACPCKPSKLVLALGIALPIAGFTQTAPSSSATTTLDTVLIKARGRDETQQSVPLSVKAFSAKAIEEAGIKAVGDFVAVTPNLSLAESQSSGTSFMTIRGLSQVRNGETPMAVVVDGVIQSDAKQFGQELFDIQSIEVLRGPQGALYGRNAAGGAILINTKQPKNTTEAYLQTSVGNGGHKQVQGSIGGAIVPSTLLYRLSGSYTDRDGYYNNEFLGKKVDAYQDTTLRGQLKWNATDDLGVDLRINHVRDKSGGLNFQYQPTHVRDDCTGDLSQLFDFSRVNPDAVSRRFCATNLGINTRAMDEITAKFDYNLSFATLTGVTSYNHVSEYVAGDQFPYTASKNLVGLDGTQTQFVNTKSQSYELRLTSPSKPGVRWMAGVYALKTNRFVSTSTGSDLGLGIDRLEYDPHFNSATNPTGSWFADRNRNHAWAVFGNIDWDITPKLELSAALRYDRDQRKQIVDTRQSAGLPIGCSAVNEAACEKNARFSASQPKISLRYKSDQSGLLYASWGKGFRSGQFNQSGVGSVALAAGVSGVSDQVDAENTTTTELGYKTELMNGKIRLNTALFNTSVTNAPYFVFIGAVGAQVMVGIDRISLSGGEFEAVANFAPGLDASFGVGYTHSEIKRYAVNPSVLGKHAPYVPALTANLGLQYRFAISERVRMVVRGDVVSKGKQYWDPENSAARSKLNLLNLRVALEDVANKWNVALSVQNASDKHYNSEWVSGGFAHPAGPRTVRVDLRYNF